MTTVMLVDDSATMLMSLKSILTKAGYSVETAGHGKEALDKLGKGVKPNLIISDVNMPNMDGITFLKTVKAMPAYRFTPVIMLTTENQEAKKREGQLAGAKAWVVKPFQPPTLLSAVEKLVLP